MQTPAEQLTRSMLRALVGEGLVTAAAAERLTSGVLDGTVTEKDWRAAVEEAAKSRATEPKDG